MKKTIKSKIKKFLEKVPNFIWKIDEGNIQESSRWIRQVIKRYMLIIKIFPSYPFKVFFANYSSIIRKNISNDPKIKYIIDRELKKYYINSCEKEKMIVHCIATECGILDSRFTEIILTYVMKTQNREFRYWTTVDISYSTFSLGKGIYSDYYNDRKYIFKNIANESNVTVPLTKDSNLKKICILTYQLNPDMHNSAQRVCSMFANNLVDYCDELMVLCMDTTLKTKNECSNYCTLIRTPQSSKQKEKILKLFKNGIKICYSSGENFAERAQDSINLLYGFNPSIIIDITDEYSPMSYLYSQDFFTVYVPMRGAATSQFYSAILGVPFKYEQTNLKFNNCIDMSKVLEWSFPEYIPPRTGNFYKERYRVV